MPHVKYNRNYCERNLGWHLIYGNSLYYKCREGITATVFLLSVFVRVIIHCEEKKAMKSIKMITKAYFFLLFFISFLLILITSFNLVLLATVYLGSFFVIYIIDLVQCSIVRLLQVADFL